MSDTPSEDGAVSPEAPKQAAAQQPSIRVLAQYVKDLSFENPSPLTSGPGPNAPAIELGIDVKADPHPSQDTAFEVSLRLSAQARRDTGVVFIAELVYAGLFEIVGSEGLNVEPILLVECPRLLFPFARRLMAEITREGGFPPLLIDPIDFIGLYRAQKAQEQNQSPPATDESPA